MKTRFLFRFINRNRETGIHYDADYDGVTLSIDIVFAWFPPGMSIPRHWRMGKAVDPWTVFYEHATFDSILHRGLGFRHALTEQDPAEDDYQNRLKVTGMKKGNYAMGHEMPIFARDDSAFLRGVAENPDRLYDMDAIARLITLFWAAKGYPPPYMTETRDQIKKMLIDNLIPKHKGGKRLDPGAGLTRKLLKALSVYLSGECRTFLNAEGECVDINEALTDTWDVNYALLIEWAREHDPRIVTLSQGELKGLIEKPAEYADAVLQSQLSVSLSTLKHSAK